MTPVTITDAAKALGVHKSTISRQVSAGIIPNHGTAGKPMVDVEEARLARAGGLDLSQQRGVEVPAQQDDGAANFQSARTKRETAQAELAELELDQRLGKLLDKQEVIDAFFTLFAELREQMEARRRRLAERTAGAQGVDAHATIIAEEFRLLQQAIAESFERKFVKATADA